MAVTIKQVSEYCGISISAVSKALNGYPDIGEKTRKRVIEAAKELGYRPSAIARGLKTGRTFNLGVVYSEDSGSGFLHHFFSPILEAFRAEAEQHGQDITFISSSIKSQDKRIMSYLEHSLYRNVDGVCLVCCDFGQEQVNELIRSNIPIVTIDHPFPGRCCIASENSQGMKELTEYVIAQGHRKIAMIYGLTSSSATRDRTSSFLETMNSFGLDVPEGYMVASPYHNPQTTKEAVKNILALRDRPSCIMMQDDFSALGGMEAIAEAGLNVPADISVTGFDGVEILQMCYPRLSTVAQGTQKIGQEAARQLISLIEDSKYQAPDIIKVPTRLIRGDTVVKI
ncbi:MAG: LacI family transcriptional regulator [Clostridiales bacterium]|nr:LacI family transcriptional regulator [Clostridiales bacterium]